MKLKLIKGLMVLIFFFSLSAMECHAEITGDEAFSNLTWEQVYEENILGPLGVVQSICATEDYIICIENTADNVAEPDVVSAYYKNNVDADGNPVERYSLAKRVNDTHWEHGNGMAYNPNTGEIYVALYTNLVPENRGCVFVMDPETLACTGTIKVSDDYNILGIDYIKETDQYVIQTNIEGGYSFKILDSDFRIIDDLGEFAHTAKGNNFQDLVVSGDYIMNFPLTLGLGIGDFLHVYSISRREMIADPQIDFRFEGIIDDEPESLCEIEPGVFLSAVNVTDSAGVRKIRFYKVEIPYYFNVTVSAESGQAAESGRVLRGEDFPVTLTPEDGYELSSLVVNGKKKDPEKYAEGYLLSDIRQDYDIQVSYAKILSLPDLQNGGKNILARIPLAGKVLSILAACLGVAFFCFVQHVRVQRRRKYLRARKRRNQLPPVDLNSMVHERL